MNTSCPFEGKFVSVIDYSQEAVPLRLCKAPLDPKPSNSDDMQTVIDGNYVRVCLGNLEIAKCSSRALLAT